MTVKEIRIKNFRNLKEVATELSGGTTIFYGGIGEGKTNLIEALYMLSIGRSYRTSNGRDLICWGEEEAAVRGDGDSGAAKLSMLVRIRNEGKKVEVNGSSCSKGMELLGKFRAVLFHNEDIRIVKDDPSFRRRFMDIVISQVSKNYAYSLKDYYKTLRQRNRSILDGGNTEIWDEQLASLGSWITDVREKTIKEIDRIAAKIFKILIGAERNLSLVYQQSSIKDKDQYLEQLKNTKALDVARGTTNVGPHRDDIKISVDGRDVRQFASSGEQKVVMLSMKMAEVDFIKGMTGEQPTLLLDDVFSAIDEQRSMTLLKSTGNGAQCIITTTDLNSVKRNMLGEARLYEVKNGSVRSGSA